MILWINYLYLEAVDKLSWSTKVPLKVMLRSHTFRLSQNTHGKTIRLLTVPFTLVLYSQRNAFLFAKQFWVAAAPFMRSSPSMLPVFTKYFSAFLRQHVIIEDSETTEPTALTEWETVTLFFLALLYRYTADCSAEVTHALRWHSEWPTNAYSTTTNDKRRSYPDALIHNNAKHIDFYLLFIYLLVFFKATKKHCLI